MTQWQPIESAPRDGSAILGLCAKKPEMLAWFNGWGKGAVTPPSGPCWGYSTSLGERFIDEGWDTGTGCYMCPDAQPTHWMPLPTPPENPA